MTENLILNIVGVAILCNFFTHFFEPIQGAKNRLLNFLSFLPLFIYVEKTLNCSKCLSFWTGLIVFQNIIIAALCSLIGYLVNHLIDRVEVWYE